MRFGFVARFAAVLLVCAIGIAGGLSYVFARAHLESLKHDLITTAVGQAGAALQPSIVNLDASLGMSPAARTQVAAAVRNVENFSPLVRGVRLYAPSGAALYPAGAPAQPAPVQSAIAKQSITQTAEHASEGESVVTAYVPLAGASGQYLAVAAVDVSVGQLEAQAGAETQFVVLATIAASALIFASLLTLAVAAQRELNRRGRAAETTFLQTMQGIATIVDQRDPYTAGHSQRVADYSVAIAQELALSKTLVERVRWSALLHDLGKIAIPDAVLLKPGPFDPAEREVINHHPSIAREILGEVEAMRDIVPCVLHHHERWDGKGYPAGLAGEAIPLLSRVIAVADTFDAMTTDRPYRTRLAIEEALRRLREGAGAQWDTRCVDALLALAESGRVRPPAEQTRQFGRRLALSDVRPG